MARAVLRSTFEFLVGDDLPTALGVVVSLATTALVASAGLAAWWLMPLAALALLRWSLLRRVRSLARVRRPGAAARGSAQPDSVAAPRSLPGSSPLRANSGSAPRRA